MNDRKCAERFNQVWDTGPDSNAAGQDQPENVRQALEMARQLSRADYSSESKIRLRLRQRLLVQAQGEDRKPDWRQKMANHTKSLLQPVVWTGMAVFLVVVMVLVIRTLPGQTLPAIPGSTNGSTPEISNTEMTPATLPGSNWLLVSQDGSEVEPGVDFTLIFYNDTEAVGRAGCRDFYATYQADSEGIRFTSLSMLSLDCQGGAELQLREGQFTGSLSSTRVYRMNDVTLELHQADGGILVFEPLPASMHVPLEGKPWRLGAILEPGTGEGALEGRRPEVFLEIPGATLMLEGNAAGGSGGCNTFQANYTLDGPTIRFEPLVVTDMYCAEPVQVMEQEQRYLEVLQSAGTYHLSGYQLWLEDSQGRRLIFVSAEQQGTSQRLTPESAHEDIRRRIISPTWTSVWVEGQVTELATGSEETGRQAIQVQAWLDRDGRGRVISTDRQLVDPLSSIFDLSIRWIWISDGQAITTYDADIGEAGPAAVQAGWIGHPLENASPLVELLFPFYLALRSEDVQVSGMESQAGREALVVDWAHYRLWVDSETGVLLKQQTKGPDGDLISEVSIETVVYGQKLSAAILETANWDLVQFEPAPGD